MAPFLGSARNEQRRRQACRSSLQRRASNPRHRLMKTLSIDEVMTKQTSIPKSLTEATRASGLLRAWPIRVVDGVSGSSPDVPRCLHPTVPDLDLYVGISPS